MIRTYGEATYESADGPFGGALIRATNVLCPDGIRRTAWASHDGHADTFFSVPAYVYGKANGRTVRVYGYVSIDDARSSRDGHALGHDADVRFSPYLYRRHAASVCHPLPLPLRCRHCTEEVRPIRESEGFNALAVATSDYVPMTHTEGSYLCDLEAYRRDGSGTHAEYVPTLAPYVSYESDPFVIVYYTADGWAHFLHDARDNVPTFSGSALLYANRYTYREAVRMLARSATWDAPYVGAGMWQMVRVADVLA